MSGPYDPYDRDSTRRSDWSEGADPRSSRSQRPGGSSRPNAGQGSGPYGGYGQGNPPSRGRSGYGADDVTLDSRYGRSGPTSRGRSPGAGGAYGGAGQPSSRGGYDDEGGYGRPSPSSRGGYESYAQDPPAWDGYERDAYGGYEGQAGSASGYEGYEDRGGYGGYGNAGYGQQGWGQASRTMYGEPEYDDFAAPPKKSRRKLWITLAVVATVLLVTCGGIGFGVAQYTAPAAAAGVFCGNLKVQNYATSYTLLDSALRSRETPELFAEANADLDRTEGVLTNCKAATGANAYQYSLGASSATVVLSTQRAKGGSFQGALRLLKEGGLWKVAALDPALFGVDLQALVSMDTYCAALQSQRYDAAYVLLGKGQQTKQKAADYTQEAQWRDQIDGTISVCQVAGISAGTDASMVTLTVSVTRGTSAAHQALVALGLEDTGWKIRTGGPEAQGSDLGPAHTGSRFCDDLAKPNYTDLTTLLSNGFLGGAGVSTVASLFSGSYNGIKWNGCTLDLSTYKVSSTGGSFNVEVTLTELSSGRTVKGPLLLKFVKEGRNWKLDYFKLL